MATPFDDARRRLVLEQFTRIHGRTPTPDELGDFRRRRAASRSRGRLMLRRRAALMIMRW